MASMEDIWTSTTSPSPSPTPPPTCGSSSFLSTRLRLIAPAGVLHHGGGGYPTASAPPFLSCHNDVDSTRRALEDEMRFGPGAGAGGGSAAERRKMRLIKNRESASRSRSRKHAYLHDLQREVRRLQQQNDSLRAKYEQLRASMEVAVPAKKTLTRMLSAPF